MLEKYEENFDGDEFLQKLMEERQISKTEARKAAQKEIPLEKEYQKKIQRALSKRYPDALVVKIAQGQYSRAGIPDLMCIIDGHYFGFEIKRPILGKATGIQEETIRLITKAGGTAAIVSWPEECFLLIDGWKRKEI